jgi:hypothetical protein
VGFLVPPVSVIFATGSEHGVCLDVEPEHQRCQRVTNTRRPEGLDSGSRGALFLLPDCPQGLIEEVYEFLMVGVKRTEHRADIQNLELRVGPVIRMRFSRLRSYPAERNSNNSSSVAWSCHTTFLVLSSARGGGSR